MIEREFEKYLKISDMDNIPKNSIQYTELKRAFYGAFGMLLVLISSERPNIFDLKLEVSKFFAEESERQAQINRNKQG